MSGLLHEICARKREHVAVRKAAAPLASLRDAIAAQGPVRPFAAALRHKAAQRQIGLIAEIKKASPSRGLIRADFDPARHAADYAAAGASCLSVLTDTPYFQGEDAYLSQARSACALPVLRKDFMVDVYQVAEARAMGADCILIIMAAVDDVLARELEAAARELTMDALIEVHDEAELERALTHLDAPMIGINNRNLSTLEISLETSRRLRPLIPAERLAVCESGIAAHSDIAAMQRADIHCFLVGESLMSQADVRHATRALLGHS